MSVQINWKKYIYFEISELLKKNNISTNQIALNKLFYWCPNVELDTITIPWESILPDTKIMSLCQINVLWDTTVSRQWWTHYPITCKDFSESPFPCPNSFVVWLPSCVHVFENSGFLSIIDETMVMTCEKPIYEYSEQSIPLLRIQWLFIFKIQWYRFYFHTISNTPTLVTLCSQDEGSHSVWCLWIDWFAFLSFRVRNIDCRWSDQFETVFTA